METNVIKKGLHSIYGGLQMLSENKEESLSALAEISIILSNKRVAEYYQISEDINSFLSSLHFLLKDLSKESAEEVTKFINTINKNGVDAIDYKTKYEETLVALTDAQGKLLKNKRKSA